MSEEKAIFIGLSSRLLGWVRVEGIGLSSVGDLKGPFSRVKSDLRRPSTLE